jgi:hypothetical protein
MKGFYELNECNEQWTNGQKEAEIIAPFYT